MPFKPKNLEIKNFHLYNTPMKPSIPHGHYWSSKMNKQEVRSIVHAAATRDAEYITGYNCETEYNEVTGWKSPVGLIDDVTVDVGIDPDVARARRAKWGAVACPKFLELGAAEQLYEQYNTDSLEDYQKKNLRRNCRTVINTQRINHARKEGMVIGLVLTGLAALAIKAFSRR